MSEREPHIQFNTGSVYGGSLTSQEFYKLEFDIDLELQDFDNDPIPFVRLKLPLGEIISHHHNTQIFKYADEWEDFCHILIDDKEQYEQPIYFFRNTHTLDGEEEKWVKMASAMLEKDFTLVAPPEKPNTHVMEMYWQGARGEEPIEQILGRILLKDGTE